MSESSAEISRSEKLHGASRPKFLKVVLLFGLSLLAGLFLTILNFYLFTRLPIDSDQANTFFAALEFGAGNWRLHDWTLPPDNFWGLEIPLTAMTWSVTHDAVFVLRFVPAFAWLLLSISVLSLNAVGQKANWLMAILFSSAFFFVLPDAKNAVFFFAESPIHVLTVTCIMWCIFLAQKILSQSTSHAGVLLTVYTLITIDASASDPLFVMLGALPIVLALIFAEFPPETNRFNFGTFTILATIFGRLIVLVNSATGGFHAAPTDFTFVDFFAFPHSILIIFRSILQIFNCDFFGLSVQQRLIQIVRLPLLLLVGIPFYWTIYKLYKSTRSRSPHLAPPFIETVLTIIIITNIATMLASNVVVNMTSARFLLPAWAALTVLTARGLMPSFPKASYFAILAIISLGSDVQIALHKKPPAFSATNQSLASCLETLNLPHGYATYWLASSVTLASNDKITVRALSVNNVGQISPMLWLATKAWYPPNGTNSEFFVITQAHDTLLPREDVLADLGTPQTSINIDDATINIYGQKIDPNSCSSQTTSPKVVFSAMN